jgi:hypothetical protein
MAFCVRSIEPPNCKFFLCWFQEIPLTFFVSWIIGGDLIRMWPFQEKGGDREGNKIVPRFVVLKRDTRAMQQSNKWILICMGDGSKVCTQMSLSSLLSLSLSLSL